MYVLNVFNPIYKFRETFRFYCLQQFCGVFVFVDEMVNFKLRRHLRRTLRILAFCYDWIIGTRVSFDVL